MGSCLCVEASTAAVPLIWRERKKKAQHFNYGRAKNKITESERERERTRRWLSEGQAKEHRDDRVDKLGSKSHREGAKLRFLLALEMEWGSFSLIREMLVAR